MKASDNKSLWKVSKVKELFSPNYNYNPCEQLHSSSNTLFGCHFNEGKYAKKLYKKALKLTWLWYLKNDDLMGKNDELIINDS